VIWGVKVPVKEVLKLFPLKKGEHEEDVLNDPDDYLYGKIPQGLSCHGDRFYFSSDKSENIFFGQAGNRLEDGSFVEIGEPNKAEIVKKLKSVGIQAIESDIKLYVQMISNDNF
jgi:hypothetical protein